MRSKEEMYQLILATANKHPAIRAVLLQGSRADEMQVKDTMQDYDLLMLVNDLNTFNHDAQFIDVFGPRLIMQQPNEMQLNPDAIDTKNDDVVYLMRFTDGNRIDLTLRAISTFDASQLELSKVLLDKDHIFDAPLIGSNEKFWIQKPNQKDFTDCCNEFWWVATYVAKGLNRDELIYAKDMLEGPVRAMFTRVIAWQVAMNYNFEISLGVSNRKLKRYLPPTLWARIKQTYPNLDELNIWSSLLIMMELFHESATDLSAQLQLSYDETMADAVQHYIAQLEIQNRR